MGADDRHLVQHFLEGRAPADDIFEAVLRANFCFEMQLLVFEIAQMLWEDPLLRGSRGR